MWQPLASYNLHPQKKITINWATVTSEHQRVTAVKETAQQKIFHTHVIIIFVFHVSFLTFQKLFY